MILKKKCGDQGLLASRPLGHGRSVAERYTIEQLGFGSHVDPSSDRRSTLPNLSVSGDDNSSDIW